MFDKVIKLKSLESKMANNGVKNIDPYILFLGIYICQVFIEKHSEL